MGQSSFLSLFGAGVHRSLVTAFTLILTPGAVQAQWTVTDLSPSGSTQSVANGVFGGQQVGASETAGVTRASLWNSSAASWVDLSPAGALDSQAIGVSGGQQVGFANIGAPNASLWSGSAASWVNLNPAGALRSLANGVFEGQQVGWAELDEGVRRASLWNGSASSWVDLHALLPAGFTSSMAQGIWSDGSFTYIAGYGIDSLDQRHAFLWTTPVPSPAPALLLGMAGILAARRRRM